jgi:hypothetical protein
MHDIAILIPVCSRNQNYQTLKDTTLYKKTLPSLKSSKENNYNYTIFIGIDDDDTFYLSVIDELKMLIEDNDFQVKLLILTDCKNAPATAWNCLASEAYSNAKYDYFFQIGDDIELISKNWTTRFIEKLKQNNNLGVVGPINISNYNQRFKKNMKHVIENTFVHRTHLDIFQYYFHPHIKNWFCDDWITGVYREFLSYMFKDIVSINNVRDVRYNVSLINFEILVDEDIIKIKNYLQAGKLTVFQELQQNIKKPEEKKKIFSYCLYGNLKKYCLGMIRNLEQIKIYFPEFETYIHIGNDVPDHYKNKIKEYKNVKVIEYDYTGAVLMTTRFFNIDDDDIDVMILRDADSKFTERCLWSINDFLISKYKIFTVRDHFHHTSKIMGGQSGFKNIKLCLKDLYEKEWCKNNKNYWDDQHFLNELVYIRFIEELIVYTDIIIYPNENVKKIDVERKHNTDFCGNVINYDENDVEYFEFSL